MCVCVCAYACVRAHVCVFWGMGGGGVEKADIKSDQGTHVDKCVHVNIVRFDVV